MCEPGEQNSALFLLLLYEELMKIQQKKTLFHKDAENYFYQCILTDRCNDTIYICLESLKSSHKPRAALVSFVSERHLPDPSILPFPMLGLKFSSFLF